ncbi:MAG: SUMF1/EgtB/PvdO family nonheme iron enzyme [Flavobacteriales bacterium]|nr:SUMF1/EgtB/PvdO family nonheme iron enzyme [Flavobacteriales bacterium]
MCPVFRHIALLGSLLAGQYSSGNNISITQPLLVDFNSTAGTVDARFTISWQNSWRVSTAPANWDAAWVFLKFRVGNADPTRTGVSSTGNTLNVGSTALLRVGMPVLRTAGTGAIPTNTVITGIPNATQVTISAAPTTALAGATVRFIRIWEHARLANDAAHLAPAGSTIRTGLLNPAAAYNATTNYGVGAFIYRSANGTGTFTASNVELRWNLGTQGLGSGGPIEVCAFGHEMVYVTGGSFRVGDGNGGGQYRFYTSPTPSSTYLIASEGAIAVGTATGNLIYQADLDFGTGGDVSGPIPAAFPKGFTAFYCMKYEVTQGDYMAFLNRLTRAQQASRVGANIATGVTTVTNRYVMGNSATLINRNGIRCAAIVSATDPIDFYCDLNGNGIGNGTTDGQWITCNFLSWPDLAAYLDWSGLRPMTEFEFEKSCRGTAAPVALQYAWGTTTIANTIYGLTGSGQNNEQIATNYSTTAGNCAYNITTGPGGDVTKGPLRVGILAGHGSNSGRTTAGAGYYGAMELSGNVEEFVVSVGLPQGRAFNGSHGNGALNAFGQHDATSWPGITAAGTGSRGGCYYTGVGGLRISDRTFAIQEIPFRGRGHGGRGGRTMP